MKNMTRKVGISGVVASLMVLSIGLNREAEAGSAGPGFVEECNNEGCSGEEVEEMYDVRGYHKECIAPGKWHGCEDPEEIVEILGEAGEDFPHNQAFNHSMELYNTFFAWGKFVRAEDFLEVD